MRTLVKGGLARLTWLAGVSIAAMLSACVVGPDYKTPEIKMPAAFTSGGDVTAAPILPTTPWWTAFNDPVLNELIERAARENLTVGQAIERVTQARASSEASNAAALPQVQAKPAFLRQRDAASPVSYPVGPYNTWQGSAQVSWEPDLFGKYARTAEATKAQIQSAEEDANAAILSLLGDVAEAYVEARGYQTRIQLAQNTQRARQGNVAAIRAKVAVGNGSELDSARAEGESATAAADLEALNIQFKTVAFRLAVLLSADPDEVLKLLTPDKPIPVPTAQVAAGIPADLLRNRPDVRRSERTLALATAKIGIAEANLYPSLSITGMIGAAAGRVTNLVGDNALNANIGPAISIPLFDGGARKAQVDIANSQTRQQAMDYKLTVLKAVQDVETALSSYTHEAKRRDALAHSAGAYARAASISRKFYGSGAVSYIEVLDADRALYLAQDQLASSAQQTASDYIALCKALGGGWRLAADQARDAKKSAKN